ncbi:MAG: hypothetical protein DVB29_01275 [Verrucomicrobia bacterium]|nr:MAG: hypothetical protein DVB29_01275 [Verrucomicrobiota bacterium]
MNIRVFFTVLAFSLFLLGGNEILLAQQAMQPDSQFVAPKKRTQAIQRKVEKESLITPDGILTKAYQSKRPWEMVSPFASQSYGDGQEMISENPNQLGKQNGLIIFGIEW